MGFGHTMREIIWKLDFFVTSQVLRVNSQPDFKTMAGGITSITIIVALLATFYNKVTDTLDKVEIAAALDTKHFEDPSLLKLSSFDQGKFMFGVEIWKHDLNTGNRFFDVVLQNTFYIDGDAQLEDNRTLRIPLEPCTKEHWSGYPQIVAKFDKIQMFYWKCLPKNAIYTVFGKFSSSESMTLDVAVLECSNNTQDERPCAPPEQIDALFAEQGNFFYTVYFVNALINPSSHQYLSYYLEDSNYIMFDKNGGQEAQLWIQDFTITTDQSIFPFAEQDVETGGIVTKNAIKNRYNTVNGLYGTFFFFKSPNSQSIVRSFKKIDEILAYIGGLFGTIVMALFLVSIYNEYSFEIAMASYLYQKKDNVPDKQNVLKKYHFGHFLAQLLYGILRKFKIKPNWPMTKEFYIYNQEMVRQLDILYLFKRINFLQRSLDLLVEDHQIKGLHLMKQLTFAEAKEIRMKYKLKAKIKQQMVKKQKDLKKTHKKIDRIKSKMQIENSNSVLPQSDGQTSLDRLAEEEQQVQDVQNYTGEGQLSDQEEIKEQSTVDALSLLAKEATFNSLSSKIWNSLDKKVKDVYCDLKQRETHINSIENELLFQDQNNQNLRFNHMNLNSTPKESQVHINGHYNFQNSEREYQLPRLNRRNIRKLDEFGNGSISMITDKANTSLNQLRMQEENECQRYK